VSRQGKTFTAKQGQYLAYIHLSTRLHRRRPAETDMQEYFRVSPPSRITASLVHLRIEKPMPSCLSRKSLAAAQGRCRRLERPGSI
jgi:hypothetical protein